MDMLGGLGGPSFPELPEGVEKEILVEASTLALDQPRTGDVVTVELEVAEGVAAASRTWALGTGKPLVVAEMDMDRCIRTMRAGERASFKRGGAQETDAGATLRLVSFERREDLLGDGSLLRARCFEGVEREEALPGLDLRLRFSWRPARPRGLLDPPAPDAEGRAAAAEGERAEEATSTVLLAGDPLRRAAAAASREMDVLRRTLLQRLRGAVVVRGEEASTSAPVLRVSRGGEVLVESGDGLEVAEACRQLEAVLASPSAPPAKAGCEEPREVIVNLEEGNCRCRAADWLRGYVGMRVLNGLRAGQRCLLRVAPVHAFGAEGLEDLGLPGGVELEYDVEVLQVISSEDVSAHLCWGRSGVARKRTTRSGEGRFTPAEGSETKLRLRATDGASGDELVEEREISLEAASGRVCAVVDEVLLTMKPGETCEVHCSDAALCADGGLGLQPADGARVIFHLELLSFERIDLHGLSVPEKMSYCSRRKELGTHFFQEGLQHPQRPCSWYRALKRYRQAAVVLGGAEGWTEEKEAALALRRLCRLNMAACWLKLEAWEEAERSCSLVLKEEPENTKALFRRGQALSGSGDHAGAEQCARTLLTADPKNREAAKLLAKARQSRKAEAEQQKGLFSRMAQGIGEGAEAKEAPPAEGLAASTAAGEGPAAAEADSVVGKGLAAETPADAEAPLWPWAVAALAAASLSLVLVMRWQRQRGPRT